MNVGHERVYERHYFLYKAGGNRFGGSMCANLVKNIEKKCFRLIFWDASETAAKILKSN